MEAASCAVLPISKNRGKSIGIGVQTLNQLVNPCVGEYFELKYFFARKWLLTRFSNAYIVFPGGFGTFDEMFEIITLIQTHQMAKKPVILIGVEFWAPLLDWFNSEVMHHGAILKEDMDIFVVTDDLKQAFLLVQGVVDGVKK